MPTTKKPPVKTCVHRWLIEPPGAALSGGACIHCGATKTFNNVPNGLWDTRAWELTPKKAPRIPKHLADEMGDPE